MAARKTECREDHSIGLDAVPRRIFLDSCTAQTLLDYDYYINEGEDIRLDDKIYRIPGGLENLYALRMITIIGQRALFQWIISENSLREGIAKRDPTHMTWLWEIVHHTEVCLDGDGPTHESINLARKLDDKKFGYLSAKDRLLLQDAVFLKCDSFLTVERRLPKNAGHIQREIGIRILTPSDHWKILSPWAALWC